MFNLPILAAAAVIPLIVGFVWYNPRTFGTFWMKEAGVSPDSAKGANMFLIFGLTYVFSFFAAFALSAIVIHQAGFVSLMQGQPGFMEPGSDTTKLIEEFMTTYGDRFRTFKHGVLHGSMTGIALALPILGINALFERKSFKYIAINVGYWIVSFALMGGVICQWY